MPSRRVQRGSERYGPKKKKKKKKKGKKRASVAIFSRLTDVTAPEYSSKDSGIRRQGHVMRQYFRIVTAELQERKNNLRSANSIICKGKCESLISSSVRKGYMSLDFRTQIFWSTPTTIILIGRL